MKGFDAVLHLAAIPHPFNDPGDKVIKVNVVGTYNLLEAVRQNNIPRVIFGCSESASGLGIHNVIYKPLYFPIDEEHPSWPHESYSLNKYFGEIMCREYSRAYGIETISLRYCWVWLERNRQEIESLDLIKKLYPENSPFIKNKEYFQKNPYASLYDITKARKKLGFEPKRTWRNI